YSLQLIEWIEILNRLGISTFFLYKTLCHKNVEKVLDYYEKKGLVKIIDFHFPNPFIQEGTFLSAVARQITKQRKRLQVAKRGGLQLLLSNIEPNILNLAMIYIGIKNSNLVMGGGR
ncbi:hypothetical protein Avbf_07979, partial [Armadillidium vulgare]